MKTVTAADSLSIRNVSKTFAGQRALIDIDLDFVPGHVHCVLGQNGSGKSTLLKVLSGYHSPDSGGDIRVGGDELLLGRPAESLHLGLRFVHQQTGIIDELSALENMALGSGYLRKWNRRIDWPRMEQLGHSLLARLDRDDIDLHRPMSEARAVDRTAVAISRALDPSAEEIRFLFLDEPTATLPLSEVEHLFDLVRNVRDQGIGVIYVTHRLDEVFRIADRVTVLRDGRLVGTHEITTINQDQLIDLIVGEAGVSQTYAPRATTAALAADDRPAPRVAVRGLSTQRLHSLDLEVRPGEILGVAGLDGSGREEVNYALVGAIPATIDSLKIDGIPVPVRLTPRSALAHGIAMAVGNRRPGAAVAEFSIRENVTLPTLAAYRRRGRIIRRREYAATDRWLHALSIRTSRHGSPADSTYTQLSGGNQQKVILAKWLNAEPQVLLLDEPTAGVDIGAREAIYELIRGHVATGLAAIVTSSDIQDFIKICDRVCVIRDGNQVLELSGDHIQEAALLAGLMGV